MRLMRLVTDKMREDALRSSIEERIRGLLVSELNVDAAIIAGSVSGTSLLGRGVGLDSVEILGLVVCLEQEFQISVPDSELTVDLFKNIGTLADYVFNSILQKNGTGLNGGFDQ
jgi:acyl carrier protein